MKNPLKSCEWRMTFEFNPYELSLMLLCMKYWLENPQTQFDTPQDKQEVEQENEDIKVLHDRLQKFSFNK